MADEETYILTKEDFQEQQEVIKKQILGNTKLEGREKRMALTVLDGIGQCHGWRRPAARDHQTDDEGEPAYLWQDE